MNRRLYFYVCVLASVSLLFPFKLNADPTDIVFDTGPTISMDFQDAALKDILKLLSMQSGLNFIASEGVQERKITLYLDKVPLSDTMDKLFKANNLSYELYKEAGIFIVKDLGKPQTETITKVFYLKYATVSSSSLKEEMSNQFTSSETSGTSAGGTGKWAIEDDVGITKAVKKLLSDSGSVIEDYRTNSLIVTDTPMRMAVISKVIASLDVSVPQVLLEVEMLDVSKNAVDKLGVNWPTTIASLNVTGTRNTQFPFFGSKAAQGITGTHFASSVLTVIGANLTLDFLRSQTDTKFLARPKILTLNNEPAEIKIATNESIGIKTSTTGSESISESTVEPERTETGVILRVTPQVNPDTGEITMMVYPKVAEAVQGNTFTSNGQTFQFRDPEERSTKSVVRLQDGETVVIGGLIRNEFQRQETRVPFASNIPVLGWFFKHTGGTTTNPDKNKERELLVFITPHIMPNRIAKDEPQAAARTNVELPKANRHILSMREQATDKSIQFPSVIDAALNKFEKEE